MPLENAIPLIDDRSYDSLLAELRTRIARYTPEWTPVWTDVNDNDPGITMAQIVEAWMESKQHRENMLGTEFTEIGLGMTRDGDSQIYYTQLFARPQGKP